ncbi:CDP-glycerol glycerophosphotransferase family protein [Actinospongicola halichondriae]|uniref:CDP-glycerol glycerophosphotransferase family protein n=1 Tax=Actinospongicola halichondriae TaxID=3236844 RepID=UPI003D58768C
MHRPLQTRIGSSGRRIALPLLRALDRVVQPMVPVVDDRVCYVSIPDYTDNAYWMYRHLLEVRRDLEHVWLLSDMSQAQRVRDEFAGAEARGHRLVIKRWSARSYLDFMSARVCFHTHGAFGYATPRGRRVSVCLWHGMPVKAIRRLERRDEGMFPVYGSVHVATSSFFRYIIAGVFDAHPRDVLVSGLPRTDVLKGFATPNHDRAAIASQLGFDPDRRWILWMPTHRSEPDAPGDPRAASFLDALDPALLEALAEAGGEAQVIVKLHPMDVLNHRPVDLGPSITLLTAPQWQATGIQLYDLVAASDALITDVSSIFIDYLHTGNPIGVMGFDPSSYTRDTLFDHGHLLRCDAAHRLDTPDDVKRFVDAIDPSAVRPSGSADLSVVFNEDGDTASASAIADAVGL